jgi:hypothetical protein
MRTAILLGAILIADAIDGTPGLPYNENAIYGIGVILLVCMIMDVVDFGRHEKSS